MRTVRSVACLLLLLLAAFVVLIGEGRSAYACTCNRRTDVESFAFAEMVFTGELVEVEELSSDSFSTADPQHFVFEVAQVFKGDAAARQTIVTEREGASCGLEINGPGPFVVFTESNRFGDFDLGPGELYAGLCGGTRPSSAGAIPAAFGVGRPPTPAVSAPVIAETGAGSGTVTWLIPVGGAAVATGAAALAMRRRRTTS